MKVAVYTIAKNEEHFVERWYESAKDADYLLIADTGSQDGTVELAKSLGINVVSIAIKPWRFDDARNASLAAIPLDIDYCVALDMDEVLVKGWRQELENCFSGGVTRPRYQYTWSWNSDGTPDLQYGADKIHTRSNYRWKHPVHEVLKAYDMKEIQGWCGIQIEHYPDTSKSRGQYLPLLKMAVDEDPNDDRNAYYYARELYFNGLYSDAIKEFNRHLGLPTASWAPERASSYRYLAKCEPSKAFEHLHNAITTAPDRRESIIEMAQLMYYQENWVDCYEFALDAIKIKDKPLDFLCEAFAWGDLPYDLASISAWNMGMIKEAIEYAEEGILINPNNIRLQNNLGFYKQALA